jgi:protein arginine N-methyltransferase 3
MSESTPTTRNEAPVSSGSSEASDILDLKDDEGWEDAEPDEEETQFISLLDDEVFTDLNQMLAHCKEKHKFDFLEIRQRLGLDFYGNIKLVNYIRSQVHSGAKVTSDISKADFDDEKYLKPLLEDDALLFSLDELPDVVESSSGGVDKGKGVDRDSGELVSRVSELEEELRMMQVQFDNYRATVTETLDERWNSKDTNGPSSGAEKEEKRDDDSHYFSSYSYNGQFLILRLFRFTNISRHP